MSHRKYIAGEISGYPYIHILYCLPVQKINPITHNFLFLFNNLIDIDGTLKIFSRRTLSRRILENYTFICEKLKNVFESDPRPSVCTTADIWSTKHKSFMGVTAHWVHFFLF